MEAEPLDNLFAKQAIGPAVLAGAALLGRGTKSDTSSPAAQSVSFMGRIGVPAAGTISSLTGGTKKPGTPIGALTKAVSGKPIEEIKEEALDELFDPVHDAELSRIKTQAMMSEFLSTDPVISTYDPDQVFDAYNQIVMLAPRAGQQPAVMRGMLRKMLQQQDAMEPFEAKELIDIEKGIKDIAEPAAPALAPMRSAGEAAGVLATPQGAIKHMGV